MMPPAPAAKRRPGSSRLPQNPQLFIVPPYLHSSHFTTHPTLKSYDRFQHLSATTNASNSRIALRSCLTRVWTSSPSSPRVANLFQACDLLESIKSNGQ